jgi:YHS domain-containing protein
MLEAPSSPEEGTTIKDPVCGNYVDPSVTQYRAEFRGREFYFDSPECRDSFRRDPAKYLMRVKVKIRYKPGVEPLPEGSIPTEVPEEAPPPVTPPSESAPEPGETPGADVPPPTSIPTGDKTLAPGEEVPPPTAMPPEEQPGTQKKPVGSPAREKPGK